MSNSNILKYLLIIFFNISGFKFEAYARLPSLAIFKAFFTLPKIIVESIFLELINFNDGKKGKKKFYKKIHIYKDYRE